MNAKSFIKNEKKLRDLTKLIIANKGKRVIIKKDFFEIYGYRLPDEEIEILFENIKFIEDYIIQEDEVVANITKF
jgi:hypothetical protein